MKKVLIVIITLIATTSAIIFIDLADGRDCSVDDEFKKWFFVYLERCENFTKHFEGDDAEKVLEAVYFLSAITDIQSNIYLGDVVLYEKKEFRRDKKKWLNWYKENKCQMTLAKADSIYSVTYKEKPKLEWQK
jgi:hypothetical protein